MRRLNHLLLHPGLGDEKQWPQLLDLATEHRADLHLTGRYAEDE